jgi:transcriptional regulator with XRE-family HTH domain
MKFKELLKAKGFTQVELAKSIGCGQSLISQWIRGDCEPNLMTLVNMSRVLKVPVDELIAHLRGVEL